MTGRGVRFFLGLMVGIAAAAFVKGTRTSENHSEGATSG
jgi:hypothetical protein